MTVKKLTLSLAATLSLSFFSTLYAADNGTEVYMEDDVTIYGTGGTPMDPDLEVKGFSVFGTTQAAPALQIPVGPGNIFVNGYVQVSSGMYAAGSSTFTSGAYFTGISSFAAGPGNIYVSGGNSGQVMSKMAGGGMQWADPGDDLGSHIATTTLNLAGWNVVNVSSVNFLPNVFLTSATAAQYSGVYVSTHIYTPANIYANKISAAGDVTAARYQIGGSTVLAILSGDSLGIGVDAGKVSTGISNLYVGKSAGFSNTTGNFNSFLGYLAGDYNTGSGNSFVGYSAGYYNQAGSANAIFGSEAGRGLGSNSFSSSTIVGYQAGYGLLTGGDNIFLGWKAGYAVTTGSGNILIGYNANASSPGAINELNIGDLIYGRLDAGTVGISTRVPQAALDIVSTGTLISQYAQIWRNSAGTIVSSMTATGVLYPKTAAPGDNLGNHIATTTLDMNSWNLVNVSSVNFKSSVFISSAAVAQGGGVYVSSNVYMVGFSSAARYYGNGSGLTNVVSTSAVQRAGDTMTGQFTVAGASITVNSSDGNLMRLNSSLNYGAITFLEAGSISRGTFGYTNGLHNIFFNDIAGAMALTGSTALQLGVGANAVLNISGANKAGVNVIDPQYALDISTANAGDAYLFRAGKDGILISTGGAIQTTGYGHGAYDGGLRGAGAVDLQTFRTNSVQVASGDYSVISGGRGNSASGSDAAVGGGATNYATGVKSVVSGGESNTASGLAAVVGGGTSNLASVGWATVGGGSNNQAANGWATVAGGINNVASQNNATVGGGESNKAAGYSATVAGGLNNSVVGNASAAGGGAYNVISGSNSVIPGGAYNNMVATSAVISGGEYNQVSGKYSAIAGGDNNMVGVDSGGSSVGGGSRNWIYGSSSTIAGGANNLITNTYAFIGGGMNNGVSGQYGAVAGGYQNSAAAVHSAIGGGWNNNALGMDSFIGGGNANNAYGLGAVIAGGYNNITSQGGASVGGGQDNFAAGLYSTIPGGFGNSAVGNYSFAAGFKSSSTAMGSFTWADSEGTPVVNNNMDQVMFKARGGFWVSTGTFHGTPGLFVNQGNNVILGADATGPGPARLTVMEPNPQDVIGNSYVLKVGTGSVPAMLNVSTTGAVAISGDLNARVWQRIFAVDLAASMGAFNISGLRGNTDGEYKLIIRLKEGGVGLCTVQLQPNGDATAANYTSQYYGATGAAAVNHVVNPGGTLSYIPIATVGTGGVPEMGALIEGTLYAKGDPRVYSGTMVSIVQQTTRQVGAAWTGGAGEITSLNINTDVANCLGIGTHIELWAFR